MGWDIGEFFSNAGANAQNAIDSLVKVGVPAVETAAAQWGIDTLTSMQKESQKELTTQIKSATSNPVTGSLSAAFQTTVQNTFLQTYGLYIVLGVVALLIIGF